MFQPTRDWGTFYDRMWSEALSVSPEFVEIASFNEGYKGAQIEPATPRPIPGFTYLDCQPPTSVYYLERTAYWIGNMMAQ